MAKLVEKKEKKKGDRVSISPNWRGNTTICLFRLSSKAAQKQA
jgi:hypothetical protein